MSLTFDQETSEIKYNEKVVGHYDQIKGIVRISELEYSAKPDNWMVPLSWFAHYLSKINPPIVQEIILTISSLEDDVDEVFEAHQYLIEKEIKQNGYNWVFHKSDPDHWPSELHGHDYDKNLVLDALTGEVFDKTTRQKIKKLKKNALQAIHIKIKDTADLTEKYNRLIKPTI